MGKQLLNVDEVSLQGDENVLKPESDVRSTTS